MQTEVVNVTPELARGLLERNSINRKVMPTVVKRYARVMREGRWALNGEPIIISNSGRLLDGQHRLHAVMESGVPINALVVTGVVDDAFETINQGVVRTLPQVLGIVGKKNANKLAATLRIICKWTRDKSIPENMAVEPDEALAMIERVPHVERSVALAEKVCGTPSHVAAIHALTYTAVPMLADGFVHGVKTGENLAHGDPRLLYRDRMIKQRDSKEKLHSRERLALCIIAWNKYTASQSTSVLRWRSTGFRAEKFPEIKWAQLPGKPTLMAAE